MAEVQAQSVPSSLQKELSDEYWNMWRSAFQTYEQGEDAIHKRDYEGALLLFQSALDKFTAIQKNNPNWNKSAVDYRIALAKRKVKTTSNYLQVSDRNQRSNSNNDGSNLSEDSVKIQTLRQRLLDAEERITKLSGEVERARLASAQVNRLMSEKIQIEKDYNALQVQYKELQKNPLKNFELPDAVKQQLAESEEKMKHLQKQLETAAERNAVLVEKNDKLLAENNSAAVELKNLKQQVEALMQTQEKLTAEKQDQLELRKMLTDAESEKAKLQQSLNTHLQSIKTLEEKAKASEADLQKQQKQVEQLSQTVKEMEQLKVQLKNMQEQVKKAAEKETQSQAYIKTLDSQNKVYQRTVESLTGKLEALDGKKAPVTPPVKADDTLKKELDKAKAVYDAEIKKRDQNLAELKAKLADVVSLFGKNV